MEPGASEVHSASLDSERGEWLNTIWAVTAAFGCYFCMYAFRKPFAAASFSETLLWGLDFKTALVTSQVIGYALAKFIGIKVIAEMQPNRRAMMIMELVLWAQVALVLFGLMPRPWNAACLFLNGLALGMVFGLVLGFLEGRRLTELLTAGLCASFILADGATKSVGSWLIKNGIAEDWMPSVAGAMFLLPLGICVVMLGRIPAPSKRDIAARTERVPMNRADRWTFIRRYAMGILPLVLIYLLVTIVRSLRGDFAPEIWRELGSPAVPSVFAKSELWVALGILAINGSLVLVLDNRRAFFLALLTCGGGIGLLAATLVLHQFSLLSPFRFMVLIGLGLYLPYVAMHTTLFERLLGLTSHRGNLGFLMYVADSVGYLGYVGVMLAMNFGGAGDQWLSLLLTSCWVTVAIGAICLLLAGRYFWRPIPSPSIVERFAKIG